VIAGQTTKKERKGHNVNLIARAVLICIQDIHLSLSLIIFVISKAQR